MRVTIRAESVATGDAPLGLLVVAPVDEAAHPGLLFYTDIFGRNAASVRTMMRFASYGFTVVAPDLYRRLEPLGVAFDFEADYDRAQRDANATTADAFDADRALAIAAMRAHPRIDSSPLACVGFCIGGHLALRAANEPEVGRVVAYYPTGVHDGTLGASRGLTTLSEAAASPSALTLLFGTRDPHTDASGRETIAHALDVPLLDLDEASRIAPHPVRSIALADAEHAFMRDVGPRYDPEATDRAFAFGLAALRAPRRGEAASPPRRIFEP